MNASDERFEQLYRRYYAEVFRFLRRMGFDNDETHDLAQDTFKRLYERMDRVPTDETVLMFVKVVARNLAFNAVRDSKAKKREPITESLETSQVAGASSVDAVSSYESQSPENDLITEETERLRREGLARAIESLSDGQRACVRLWLQGYRYDEIAQALRVTVDAVKSRIRDAKRQIRHHLDGST